MVAPRLRRRSWVMSSQNCVHWSLEQNRRQRAVRVQQQSRQTLETVPLQKIVHPRDNERHRTRFVTGWSEAACQLNPHKADPTETLAPKCIPSCCPKTARQTAICGLCCSNRQSSSIKISPNHSCTPLWVPSGDLREHPSCTANVRICIGKC